MSNKLNWKRAREAAKEGRIRSEAPTPFNEHEVELEGLLFAVQWNDGLVMGVVVIDGKPYYHRLDRTMKRWTPLVLPWQMERIKPLWEAEKARLTNKEES